MFSTKIGIVGITNTKLFFCELPNKYRQQQTIRVRKNLKQGLLTWEIVFEHVWVVETANSANSLLNMTEVKQQYIKF